MPKYVIDYSVELNNPKEDEAPVQDFVYQVECDSQLDAINYLWDNFKDMHVDCELYHLNKISSTTVATIDYSFNRWAIHRPE